MKQNIGMVFALLAAFLALGVGGCGPSFEGIRFRAQRPPIDEAFRKISLAFTVDGYTIVAAAPGKHTAETGWRELKAGERSEQQRVLPNGAGPVEGRLLVRLENRGMLYDVFFTPLVRAGKDTTGTVAGVRHPLREKWEKALNALLERESKEED